MKFGNRDVRAFVYGTRIVKEARLKLNNVSKSLFYVTSTNYTTSDPEVSESLYLVATQSSSANYSFSSNNQDNSISFTGAQNGSAYVRCPTNTVISIENITYNRSNTASVYDIIGITLAGVKLLFYIDNKSTCDVYKDSTKIITISENNYLNMQLRYDENNNKYVVDIIDGYSASGNLIATYDASSDFTPSDNQFYINVNGRDNYSGTTNILYQCNIIKYQED